MGASTGSTAAKARTRGDTFQSKLSRCGHALPSSPVGAIPKSRSLQCATSRGIPCRNRCVEPCGMSASGWRAHRLSALRTHCAACGRRSAWRREQPRPPLPRRCARILDRLEDVPGAKAISGLSAEQLAHCLPPETLAQLRNLLTNTHAVPSTILLAPSSHKTPQFHKNTVALALIAPRQPTSSLDMYTTRR